MNRKNIFLATLWIAAASLAGAQAPGVDNRKLALHKTYLANLGTSFSPGQGPSALAFDGEHMWVANNFDNTVAKLDTSTAQVLATYPAGNGPVALAFDGFNMWVASVGDGKLYKLRASDGRPLLTVPFAALGNVNNEAALVFDGTNMWVLSSADRTFTKVRASDGSVRGTFGSGGASIMAFDGQSIWLANGTDLRKMSTANGTAIQIVSVGFTIESLAFDGTYIYAGYLEHGKIAQVRAADGAIIQNFCAGTYCGPQAPVLGLYPAALAFDGTYLWAAIAPSADGPLQGWTGSVIAINTGNGAIMGTFNISGSPFPSAIAFDGTNVWIADNSSDSVSKL